MKFLNSIYIMLAFFIFQSNVDAQTGPATAPVKYELIYNTSSCLYEAHAIVQSGTLIFPFNIPFPSNFTIVVPKSIPDAPIGATSYQPTSLSWTNSNNVYSPAADPDHDFHMFSISGGGAGNAYTTFSSGNDILLFEFSIPHASCDEGIRIFINGVDPNSGAAGMNGLDLSNSLKTFDATGTYSQGIEQYDENINDGGINLPKPTANPTTDCTNGTLDLFANATTVNCLGTPTFNWTGPNNFESMLENPSIVITDPAQQSGTYTVDITDGNGCSIQKNIEVNELNCLLLPVELVEFRADKTESFVNLTWTTKSEINNDYFEIQHSNNGRDFKSIGRVAGKGNSGNRSNYTFLDENPEASNYYRLKQVDFDGASTLSETRYIVFDIEQAESYAYPNPVTNSFYLRIKEGTYNVKLYNMQGTILLDAIYSSNEEINISDFPTGSYGLKVVDAQGYEMINQIMVKSN